MADPASGYVALVDPAGGLAAYYCLGPEARVPGVRYERDALDLGVGVRPDLCGAGGGAALVAWIVARVLASHGGRPVRATLKSWNTRARRAAERAGFRTVGGFGGFRHGGGDHVVMVRDP
jgi:RimJ/RimL family protein N-acetyltransferase